MRMAPVSVIVACGLACSSGRSDEPARPPVSDGPKVPAAVDAAAPAPSARLPARELTLGDSRFRSGYATALAWPGERPIALVGNRLLALDPASGEVGTLAELDIDGRDLAVLPDGDLVIAGILPGKRTGRLLRWSAAGGVRPLPVEESSLWSVDVAADGASLLVAGRFRSATEVAVDGTERARHDPPGGHWDEAAFLPGGRWLVTRPGQGGGLATPIDAAVVQPGTGKIERRFTMDPFGYHLAPGGRLLLMSAGERWQVVEPLRGRVRARLALPDGVNEAEWTADEVIVGDRAGRISGWSLSGERRWQVDTGMGRIQTLARAADGRLAFTTDRGLFATVDAARQVRADPGSGHTDQVTVLAFAGDRLASLGQEDGVRIWDLRDGRELGRWHEPTLLGLAASGEQVAALRAYGVQRYELVHLGADARVTRRIAIDGWHPHLLGATPDGRWVLGSADRARRLEADGTATELGRLDGRSGSYTPYALPGGVIATANSYAFRVVDGKGRDLPTTGCASPTGAAADAAGTQIAVADAGAVRVWGRDGRAIAAIGLPAGIELSGGGVITPDGAVLLAAPGGVALWDRRARGLYRVDLGRTATAIALHPAGAVAIGFANGQIRVWPALAALRAGATELATAPVHEPGKGDRCRKQLEEEFGGQLGEAIGP